MFYTAEQILNKWAEDAFPVKAGAIGKTTAVAGKKTVATAGTPESLGSQECGEGVYVVANPANTGAVYVFPSAGTKNDCIPLQPGDSDFWPISNISALKIDVDISGESVFWKGAV